MSIYTVEVNTTPFEGLWMVVQTIGGDFRFEVDMTDDLAEAERWARELNESERV